MIRTRKTITLASGATLLIRAPTQFDNVAVGEPPQSMMKRLAARKKSAPAAAEDDTPITQPEIEYNVRVARVMLTRCTGPMTLPDGTVLRLVEKPFHLCTDAELSIEEMADEDAQEILAAITELRKETAAAVKPFPAPATPGTGEPAPAGRDLRDIAVQAPEADGRGT